MSIKKIIVAGCFLTAACLALNLSAQIQEGSSLDRVVAIVGGESILQSDVDGRVAMLQMQDPTFKAKGEEARKLALDAIVDEKLLVAKAVEDSIIVQDADVDQRFEVFLQNEIERLGSERRVEQVYGMSIPRLKFELRPEIRNKLLTNMLMEKKFATIKVSSRDVDEFYNLYRDSLPLAPASVQVYQITKKISANAAQKEMKLELAKRVRDSIIRGGSFADFAKKYSDDGGTAENGGDLGWVQKGRFFPEFERAAFALQPGEVSQPVETPFGYHLIMLVDKRKEEVQARHILFKLGLSAEDRESAKRALEAVRDSAVKGLKSFEDLARENSDDKDTKGFGGSLGSAPLSEMPPSIAAVVEKMKDGDISEPILIGSDPTSQYYAIIHRKRTVPEHRLTITDDYKDLEQRAMMWKRMSLYRDWLAELRREIYWEVK